MPTLDWIGKDKVINHHQDVPFRVLERQYSYDENGQHQADNGSKNMIIHGDNLEALKALLPKYENRIKVIYIDPPYNTGNEGWVYNDNVNDPKIRKWLGEVVGKEGEDLSRHDKWLCMMYPRLRLLQKLLADDGAIFISIDDNEQANLKLICDEIFGASNFIANIVWKKKTNGNNMGVIPPVHDFIVVYAKHINLLSEFTVPLDEEYINQKYSNPDNDIRGDWTTTDLSANHKGPYFKIINPNTGEGFFPPKGRYWVFNEEEVYRRIADGRIIFGKKGKSRPVQKVFSAERNLTQKPDSWFDKQGYNSDGMLTLEPLIGKKVFDFPKPVSLIEYILNFSTDSNAIILDSFAGSGTTAHAVLNLNKADGGNRKFILVEMMDYAETITAERVKRVISGYGENKKAVDGTGGDFSYYGLGEPLLIDGNLNESVGIEKIQEYIWYTETRQPYFSPKNQTYYLGIYNFTAYYFHYEPDKVCVLDYDFLATIKEKADSYVIYADRCSLSDDELMKFGITFKKIPRDITRL